MQRTFDVMTDPRSIFDLAINGRAVRLGERTLILGVLTKARPQENLE